MFARLRLQSRRQQWTTAGGQQTQQTTATHTESVVHLPRTKLDRQPLLVQSGRHTLGTAPALPLHTHHLHHLAAYHIPKTMMRFSLQCQRTRKMT